MIEKKEPTTANARITIDYIKEKPDIKFSYPTGNEFVSGGPFAWIASFGSFVFLFISFIYIIIEVSNKPVNYLDLIYLLFLFIVLVLIIPSIIYFPFRKYWKEQWPDIAADAASKKYKKITNQDLNYSQKHKSYYVEIPLFNNILCDYICTKDFSKYLNSFEIKDHVFEWIVSKKKKEKNDTMWYARWYFKKKPVKGYIKVVFS